MESNPSISRLVPAPFHVHIEPTLIYHKGYVLIVSESLPNGGWSLFKSGVFRLSSLPRARLLDKVGDGPEGTTSIMFPLELTQHPTSRPFRLPHVNNYLLQHPIKRSLKSPGLQSSINQTFSASDYSAGYVSANFQ